MLKILVTMLVLASSAPMFADTGTTFGDLLYMPNSSEYLFDNKIDSASGKYQIDRTNNSGAIQSVLKNDHKKLFTNHALSYSINDYFQLGGGIGFYSKDHYINNEAKTASGAPGTQEPMVKNSASLTDPHILARYRLMNSKDNGFVLDFVADVLVDLDWVTTNGENDLYRAKRGAIDPSGDATQGNAKRGGMQYNLGAEIGKKFEVFEALAYGNYILGTHAKTQRQAVDSSARIASDRQDKCTTFTASGAPIFCNGNVDFNQDTTHDFNFGVKTLTHLYARWKWGLGVDAYYHDEAVNGGTYANGTNIEETTESYITTTISTDLRFIYTRDMFFAVGYHYGMNQDHDFTTRTNGNVTRVDKYKDDTKIHGASFQLVAKF